MGFVDTAVGTPVGDPTPRVDDLSVGGALGMMLATAGLTVFAGFPGAVVGVLVGGVWYAVGGVYALAAGHVVLGALAGDATVPLDVLAVIELGLVITLLESDISTRDWRAIGVFLVAVAGCWGIVALTRMETASLPLAALGLGSGVALVAYGLHRYQVVATDHSDTQEARP